MKWISSGAQPDKIKLPQSFVKNEATEIQVNGETKSCVWDNTTKKLVLDGAQYLIRSFQIQKLPNGDTKVSLEFLGANNKIQKTQVVICPDSPVREMRKNIVQKKGFELKSPMNGKVINVLVKAGDTVKQGQNLLIIEAMKMENRILAEQDGIIEQIKIQSGAVVSAGQSLIKAKAPT